MPSGATSPRPTVHARNLYHVSAAMWDAWAAYDPVADGVFVDEKVSLDDPAAVQAAREEAISYAAYRVLEPPLREVARAARQSLREFDRLMGSLCYPVGTRHDEGRPRPPPWGTASPTPSSAPRSRTAPSSGRTTSRTTEPVNDPLIVELPGTVMNDPNRWQPLALEVSFAQNGLPLPVGPQKAVTTHWGNVTAFALPPSAEPGLPIDPGTPPLLGDPVGDAEYKEGALGVIRYSAMLDPRDGEMVDISPAVLGANPLGTNDGTGHALNPVTGQPYEPDVVPRADFARVLAEFWADGPNSETPPGHWNTIANAVADSPGFERRLGGQGEVLDPLEWDVKIYLALNGAVHDAAVAAWGCKGHYDTVRPISMIRYMGGLGQSSDPAGPSYHPEGLPLEDGPRRGHHRGERGTRASATSSLPITSARSPSAPGPATPRTPRPASAAWTGSGPWNGCPTSCRPSSRRPSPAYVSGHSTFSRAAAEVLTAMTGSEYFPGGLGSWTIPAGDLEFEAGPSQDVPLQWATYYDAADQAGLSRLYGGIHIAADDFRGPRHGLAVRQGRLADGQPLLGRHRPRLTSACPCRIDALMAARPWGSLPSVVVIRVLRAHLDAVVAVLLAAAYLVEAALSARPVSGEPHRLRAFASTMPSRSRPGRPSCSRWRCARACPWCPSGLAFVALGAGRPHAASTASWSLLAGRPPGRLLGGRLGGRSRRPGRRAWGRRPRRPGRPADTRAPARGSRGGRARVRALGAWLLGLAMRSLRVGRGDERIVGPADWEVAAGVPDSVGRDDTVRELRDVIERSMSAVVLQSRTRPPGARRASRRRRAGRWPSSRPPGPRRSRRRSG